MTEEIGAVAGDIDDLLASHVLDAEARRRLTEIRDRLEAVATAGARGASTGEQAEKRRRDAERSRSRPDHH